LRGAVTSLQRALGQVAKAAEVYEVVSAHSLDDTHQFASDQIREFIAGVAVGARELSVRIEPVVPGLRTAARLQALPPPRVTGDRRSRKTDDYTSLPLWQAALARSGVR